MDLVSASQISKFDADSEGCERQWGFRYISKIKEPFGAAAALGTECDDTQLQPYLREGRPIDYTRTSGYIVQPGLQFLPKPQTPDVRVQKHFVAPSPTWRDGKPIGFGFQGYMDLWAPDGNVMPDAAYDPIQGPRVLPDGTVPPVVGDFKTTGNWKYQKHAADLKKDIQAQLYATAAMYFTGARVVDLIWIYFATKGKRIAKRSHLRVTADDVLPQFERINDIAIRIHDARRNVVDPLQLKPNPFACERFPGNPCPHMSRCNLSPGEIIDAKAAHFARTTGANQIMSSENGKTGGLLAKLRAKAGAPAVVASGGGAGASGVVVATQEVKGEVLYDVKIGEGGGGGTVAPASDEIPGMPSWATSDVDPRRAKPVGINPPEAKLPPPPPAPEPAPTPAPVQAAAPEESSPAKRGPKPRKAGVELGTELRSFETVTVTWAQETICAVSYNPFVVGPFSATGEVAPGETVEAAQARLYVPLALFAEKVRAEKAVSFKKFLDVIGGGK